jgi:hypothetical protein
MPSRMSTVGMGRSRRAKKTAKVTATAAAVSRETVVVSASPVVSRATAPGTCAICPCRSRNTTVPANITASIIGVFADVTTAVTASTVATRALRRCHLRAYRAVTAR